jgi:hypothetical protein
LVVRGIKTPLIPSFGFAQDMLYERGRLVKEGEGVREDII